MDIEVRLVDDPKELVYLGNIMGCPMWIELTGDPEKKKHDYWIVKETLRRLGKV